MSSTIPREEAPETSFPTGDAPRSCCGQSASGAGAPDRCPACGWPGRPIKLATVKSLLCPEALARLDVGAEWHFCPHLDCEVVYFGTGMAYRRAEVRVPVFQKDPSEDVPVCYCFGWTRRRIREEIARTGQSTAVESITTHVRAGRCACELRNPQGQCCLANVRGAVTG